MGKDSWKHCRGSLRLSHAEIKQIIAEHMQARFGVSEVKVEIWPPKDAYGNDPFANVDMPGFVDAVRPEA